MLYSICLVNKRTQKSDLNQTPNTKGKDRQIQALNRLVEAVLTSTHNLCFEQKYEKILEFLSENFRFLEAKFSIYLNRRVFVMQDESSALERSVINYWGFKLALRDSNSRPQLP